MKKIKQKKSKKPSKTTIVPKMSAARQNYIKRFRRNLIRQANHHFRQTLKDHLQCSPSQPSRRKKKMNIDDSPTPDERRVRFDEDSNETYENPRWIDPLDGGQEQQEVAQQPKIEEDKQQDDQD